MDSALPFDVFLSHTSADASVVERIATELRSQGCRVFLSQWDLIPGEPWQEALEQALQRSRSCAVFLGPSGIGSWENEELRVALQLRAQTSALRVIPVLLPRASLPDRAAIPLFLSRLTWVDMRDGVHEHQGFARLLAGIRGHAPGPLPAAVSTTSPEPFRGLASFRAADAEWFFGRNSEIQQLLERLKHSTFLAVLGASGSGKSSLIHAGLVPALATDARGDVVWSVITLTPTAFPLEQLALALGSLLSTLSPTERLKEVSSHPAGLRLLLDSALSAKPENHRVLLCIDQFEELFTLCSDVALRATFVDVILGAPRTRNGRVAVVLGMRADFVASCADLPALADHISAHNFFVTPMVESQLQEVIDGPCQRAGLTLDEGVRDALLRDASGEAGALPLLEHTLFELWRRRTGQRLTMDVYKDIGGASASLRRTADALYTSVNATDQATLKAILLSLVQLQPGLRPTRRRAALSILSRLDPDTVSRLVERLVRDRLVVSDVDRAGQGSLTLAHESLVEHWNRLAEWIREEQELLRGRARLDASVAEWRSQPRLLLTGRDLVEAIRLQQDRSYWLSNDDDALITASLAARRQSERRLTLAGLCVGGVLALFALTTGSFGSEAFVRLGRVEGASQAPSLVEGERVIGLRIDEPSQGDIVFMYYPINPDKLFIKRVIAVENDDLQIVDGRVSVNGELLSEPYITDEFKSHDDFGPIRIGEGQFFVMGDNRNNSSDSRHWSTSQSDIFEPKSYIAGGRSREQAW